MAIFFLAFLLWAILLGLSSFVKGTPCGWLLRSALISLAIAPSLLIGDLVLLPLPVGISLIIALTTGGFKFRLDCMLCEGNIAPSVISFLVTWMLVYWIGNAMVSTDSKK